MRGEQRMLGQANRFQAKLRRGEKRVISLLWVRNLKWVVQWLPEGEDLSLLLTREVR
jgi:hypothetical protein